MQRVLLSAILITLVGAAAVSFGLPPAPPPAAPPIPVPLPPVEPAAPRPLPPTVTGPARPAPAAPDGWAVTVGGSRPAAGADAPLAAFEPLAAFPQTTQNAVRAAILGADWMTRANQPHGRFLPGYRPALRQVSDADHDLNQAVAALALARAAAFAGDDRQATTASQAVLALLAATRVDPAEPEARAPVASSLTCNRVGFAAALALAIYDLPGADERLTAEAERLCGFLRKQCRPDGSIACGDGPTDPAAAGEYPGYALQAVAASHRVRPAGWKAEAAARAVGYYRARLKEAPTPALAAALVPAFADLAKQTGSADATAATFEAADWLLGLQYPATDPRHPGWVGGFRGWAAGRPADAEPGCECGAHLQAVAAAYEVTRRGTDVALAARYRAAAQDAAHFVAGLQYTKENTQHFEGGFARSALVGGFHRTPTDGNIPTEGTAQAVAGLVRFLTSGAGRN